MINMLINATIRFLGSPQLNLTHLFNSPSPIFPILNKFANNPNHIVLHSNAVSLEYLIFANGRYHFCDLILGI